MGLILSTVSKTSVVFRSVTVLLINCCDVGSRFISERIYQFVDNDNSIGKLGKITISVVSVVAAKGRKVDNGRR